MQDCSASDPASLICLTPNVEKYRHLLSTQPSKRDVEGRIVDLEFLLALRLDASTQNYSNYTFVGDPPAMKQWKDVKKYKGGDSLAIYGQEVSPGPGGKWTLSDIS